MLTIRNSFGSLAIIGGLIGSLNFVHAQIATVGSFNGNIMQVPSEQSDSIVSIVAEAQGLQLMSPDQVPPCGTFWTVLPGPGSGVIPPLPCPPLDPSLPIYQIADGQFLVDETGGQVAVNTRRLGLQAQATSSTAAAVVAAQADAVVNLITQVQTAAANQQMRMMAGNMMAMDVPSPEDSSDDGTNSYTFNGSSYTMPDYGTNLWIAQVGISSAYLVGIVSNSQPDISYEIQSLTDLTQAGADWNSEGFIFGSELTNWTPMSVAQNSRTNLFLRIRSWADTQSVGIPDWWQLQYFGYVGVDPNADPDGDGLSNIQEYLLGTDPTVFNLPDAPSNFIAVLSTNGTNVLLSWNPSPQLVPNYTTLGRYDYNYQTGNWDFTSLGSVNGNATSFVDVGVVKGGDYWDSYYQIQVVYARGSTPIVTSWISLSSPIPPTFAYNIPLTARLVRNSTGRWQLMCLGLSADAQFIRLTWTDNNGNSVSQDISTNSLTDGIYCIPDTDAVNYMGDSLSVQLLGSNGEPGQFAQAGFLPNDAPYFVDGRRHMKQNLNFLIRGACPHLPYMGVNNITVLWSGSYNQNSTNFEEFSFLYHGSYYGSFENMSQFQLDNLWPFLQNYHLLGFILNTSTYTNVYPQLDPEENWGTGVITPTFNFQPNFATNIPAPPVLGDANPYWIIQPEFVLLCLFGPPYDPSLVGVDVPDGGLYAGFDTATLPSGTSSVFGFPYQTGCLISVNRSNTAPLLFQTIVPGATENISSSELAQGYGIWSGYASQCPTPSLQFVNYYFAPLINPNLNPMNLPGAVDYSGNNVVQYPTPLDDTFKVTNQTPAVMVGSVGQPMVVGSWAKYSIQGSSPTKYAYLGQYYMTNAYLLGTNGVTTTNSAGILSPYGEFFPTAPGQAVLVTMPDIDPPYQQATCVVQVIKLQLDGNHDGNMDLSFNGPDTTSPSQPYVFWVDNNYDRLAKDKDDNTYYEDDVKIAQVPDCNYTDFFGSRIIPTERDLEDYARLWICGVTSNLLAALPTNSTVTLSWGDVSNPNPNNPTIDLFTAADPDGGIGYLTNATIAAEQTNIFQSPYIQRLGPGQSIQLNANIFGNTWRGNYFIWCGVTNGSGSLTLTFKDGNGNILGQSSVYIQLKDIKQMYERWSVGDNPSRAPVSTAYPIQDQTTPQGFQYPAPWNNNTPYILYVHGWNMEYWEKDRFAETAFKRLYWQGYHGRFGVFRWPTDYDFNATMMDALFQPHNYDGSEYTAWQSATGLLNKLNDLNAQYPGHVYVLAHSMGNVVTGEALRLAAQQGLGQLVNTYVGSQAAIPAHVYDATVTSPYLIDYTHKNPNYPFSAPGHPKTPNIYGNRLTNNIAAVGHRISFFNINDYALSPDAWCFDQELKPDTFVGGYYYYAGSTNDAAPWNHFEFIFTSGDPPPSPTSLDIVNNLNDRCEALAYAADPYSRALGSTPNVLNISQNLDLTTVWPTDTTGHNYADHFWHSAQFRGDCWQEWGYWHTLLFSSQYGFNISNP